MSYYKINNHNSNGAFVYSFSAKLASESFKQNADGRVSYLRKN